LGTYLDETAAYPVIKSRSAFDAPAERKGPGRASMQGKRTGQGSESNRRPVD
jgi:hypothetical protein